MKPKLEHPSNAGSGFMIFGTAGVLGILALHLFIKSLLSEKRRSEKALGKDPSMAGRLRDRRKYRLYLNFTARGLPSGHVSPHGLFIPG